MAVEDARCDDPASRTVQIGLTSEVTDMTPAGPTEQTLGGSLRVMNIALHHLHRGRRDERWGHAGWQRRMDTGESAMGTAADGAVADMDGERKSVRAESDSVVDVLAVALGGKCRRG